MINFVPFSQTHTKHNGASCTINEYIFNQPSVDIAQAIIKGRYPIEQNKKVINQISDLIYFVLEGQCIVHTAQGNYTLNPQDALFIPHGSWYWVESVYVRILVPSAPRWYAEQYKEIELTKI